MVERKTLSWVLAVISFLLGAGFGSWLNEPADGTIVPEGVYGYLEPSASEEGVCIRTSEGVVECAELRLDEQQQVPPYGSYVFGGRVNMRWDDDYSARPTWIWLSPRIEPGETG